MVSKATILDIVMNSLLYDNLYIQREDPYWKLDLFINPPAGWEHVKSNQPTFSKENIIKHVTFINILNSDNSTCQNTDSDHLWKKMEPIFWLVSDTLTNHVNVCAAHMEAMMKAALEENVQYLESRTLSYNKVYELDDSPEYVKFNGKHNLDTENGERELEIIENSVQDFTKKNANFIGYKRIVNSIRGFSKEVIQKDMEKAYALYKKFPNLVVGFDMVAEEDNGYSYLYFLENFASLTSQHKCLPYYLHAGETIWPGDIMTSHFDDDLVGAEENLLDAIAFGVKRIGHGLSLIKHPYLLNVLKEKKIAIEVNPVSNMLLGYVYDQRTHPAITFLRYGVPVILGADDPGSFGYNEFTVDWYLAFMAWGLDLVDLKQLAKNSLEYSAMSDSEKGLAFQKWGAAWDIFVSNMKEEACNYLKNSVVENSKMLLINSILPHGGPTRGENYIYIFGRNFQLGICQKILCKFDETSVIGHYIADHMAKCKVPKKSCQGDIIDISISFDNGLTFISTNQTYEYF